MPEQFSLICDEPPQDIVILDVGPRPLDMAKALQVLAGGIGLWRAKQIVTQPPPVAPRGRGRR